MRSFQQLVVFLFALLVCAVVATEPEQYDSTVYITSTVYRVNTVTLSGYATGSLANQTSTISAVYPTGAVASYPASNGTATVASTGSLAQPSPPQFTGAASSLKPGFLAVALAAGIGHFVL